jgi:hypothetical protein
MKKVIPFLVILILMPAYGRESVTNIPAGLPTQYQARIAELRAWLASSDAFYVELRLADKTIDLCHSGVVLKSYPLNWVGIGFPHVFGVRRGGLSPWIVQTLKKAAIVPTPTIRRVRIVPGDQSTLPTPDVAGIIPPTMEEIMPVPASFRIVFDQPVEITVKLRGEIPGARLGGGGRKDAWHDFAEASGIQKMPSVKLRIEMEAVSGAALYRSFPDSPSLLVVP